MSRCLLCESETAIQSWAAFFGAKAPLLCENCSAPLKKLTGPFCKICCREMKEAGVCPDCAVWEEGIFHSNHSFYQYNDAMKELIARFKYRGDYALADLFAQDIKRMASRLEYDIICPVPLSLSRLAERRFNQSAALIEQAGLPQTALLGRRESDKQSKKTRAERINAEQTFYPIGDAAGKTILIIDDIYTTGATMRLVSDALQKAGAVSVKSIAIARSGS
ncbi:ComF family protein [Domibacillus sp. PGB-M46]|uniref:ComF family protein n=1 Tax=Domibacillus sp. PGB-M46 TaxID=2910255 RepID=UPI001F5A871E|nr:ComF family protein [Domibacillus sp. PGB-M46]MCI2253014.1 ComF family protein [Domibacillus sp. PGB-M46]